MRCDFVAFLESFVSVETLKSRAEATDAAWLFEVLESACLCQGKP